MEEQELLGIIFRSDKHIFWCIGTQLLLIAAIIVTYTFCRIKDGKNNNSFFINVILFIDLSLFHLSIGIIAYFKTDNGIINGTTWSGDCIWYNFIMAGVYILLCLLYKILSIKFVKNKKT